MNHDPHRLRISLTEDELIDRFGGGSGQLFQGEKIGIVDTTYPIPPDFIDILADIGSARIMLEVGINGWTAEEWCRRLNPTSIPQVTFAPADVILDQCTILITIPHPSVDFLGKISDRCREVWTMVHEEVNHNVTNWARARDVRLVHLDKIIDPTTNKRRIECLELTGACGAEYGLSLWRRHYEKLMPRVIVLGANNIAKGAIRWLFQNDVPCTVAPKHSLRPFLLSHIERTDILINGINWPQEWKGKYHLLTRSEVNKMPGHAVIIDLDVDYGGLGPIETCRATTLNEPTYEECGVTHACLWGWSRLRKEEAGEAFYSQILRVLAVDRCLTKGLL